MAVGTTSNFTLKRNDIIASSLRSVKAFPPDQTAAQWQIDEAIRALNLIIRQDDIAGSKQNVNLWALSEAGLFLSAGSHVYSTTEGLSSSILDILSVKYRGVDGSDHPVELITSEQWMSLSDKNEVGEVEKVYFKKGRLTSENLLYVWPAPASVSTPSDVTGTDALNYRCIMGHTAAAINRPITGASWRLYWSQTGSGGAAWVSGTAYVGAEILYYNYKRPLYDFDTAYDNPDMPLGWEIYLINRLAWELAPKYKIPLDEQAGLRARWKEARAEIFPSTQPTQTDYHNKAIYF